MNSRITSKLSFFFVCWCACFQVSISQECTRDCIPCLNHEDKVINIAVLLEKSTLVRALPVIYLAKQDLIEHGLKGSLEGWDVKIVWRDSECSSITAPLEAVQLHSQGKADVFLGPACDYALAPVIRFAKRWRTPVLSPGGKPEPFTNNPQFEMFVRLNSQYTELATTVKSMCDFWNWSIVAILYEDVETESAALSQCHHKMSEVYRILKENNYTTIAKSYTAADNFIGLLSTVKQKSRIITFCAESPENVYKIMMSAHLLNMTNTGEYVFFNIDLEAGPAEFYSPFNRDSAQEKEAFSAMFTVAARTPDSDDYKQFSKRVQKLAVDSTGELHDILRNLSSSGNIAVDELYQHDLVTPYMASFYEGVMMFAEAFNTTLDKKKDVKLIGNGKKDLLGTQEKNFLAINITSSIGDEIIDEITNGTFYSHLRKENLTLMNNTLPDDYAIYNLDDKFNYKVVSVYWGQAARLNMTGHQVRWPGPNSTVVPKDSPDCGFTNELCSATSYLNAVIGVLSILVIILALFSIIAIRKYRLEKQISSMSWKICYSDIVFTDSLGTKGARGRFGSHLSLSRISQTSINSVETLYERQVFIKSGIFKGNRVAVKHLGSARVNLTRPLLLELKAMKELTSDHLVRLMGACFDSPNNVLITEYCPRGSLQDVLENEKLTFDDVLKYSLLHDLVKGLSTLHSSEIKVHGNLKSTNCVVDSRFVLKITDFGILTLRTNDDTPPTEYQQYTKKLWTAPEILRQGYSALAQDQLQKADVYSMGIVMNELFCRLGTFPLLPGVNAAPQDIVKQVSKGGSPLMRPYVDEVKMDSQVTELMQKCWHEEPNSRPTMASVKLTVRKLNKQHESGNILDNLLNRMVSYSENLESLVEERTKDYLEEKRKCENVLYQLLPKSVARQLIMGREVMAETYDRVTIYFSDIVGFTSLSAESSPMEVVHMLNSLYSRFDETINEFDVYKVETIGDAYMVVSGLPVRNGCAHVREVARMALKLVEAVKSFQIPHRPTQSLQLRIGIHSGPCVAGVVGVKMPRYCLFGDTVNTASRMESNGLPLKIHVSHSTYELLNEHFPTFKLQLRGQIQMKGKGLVTTYWLMEETNDPNAAENPSEADDKLSDEDNAKYPEPISPEHAKLTHNSPPSSPDLEKQNTSDTVITMDEEMESDNLNNRCQKEETAKMKSMKENINKNHRKLQKTASCLGPVISNQKSNNKLLSSMSLSLHDDDPVVKPEKSVKFESKKDSEAMENRKEEQQRKQSKPPDKLRTRHSVKKISFGIDKESSTPLLTNSKSNPIS